MKRGTACLILVLTLAPLAAARSAEQRREALGQVLSKEAEAEGALMPSGSTLWGESLLETGTFPAVVHLKNGQLVEVARHSSAYFESTPGGFVQVAVRSGTVSFAKGPETVTAPPDSVILLGEEGQVGDSPSPGVVAVLRLDAAAGDRILNINDAGRINPDAPALLRNTDGSLEELYCNREVIFEDNTVIIRPRLRSFFEVGSQLLQGEAVAAAIERGVEDIDCGVPGKRGLGTWQKVGIGAGSALAAAVLIDSLRDDDEAPASPVTPPP